MSLNTSCSAIVCGVLGIALICLAIFGGSWLHCQERTVVANNQVASVPYQIGLWKVCPSAPIENTTDIYVFKTKECLTIAYNYWNLDYFNQADIWGNLQFMPQFVLKMRVCTPFAGIGLVLICAATMCSILNSMLLACGLFILAGILIGSGLLMFASILSDTYYEGMGSDNVSNIDYNYGVAFFYAAAALTMAKLAVVFSVTSYMYKFGSAEDMVRAMVPGAERRLRQRDSGEGLVHGHETIPPPAPYCDTESKRPDLCESERPADPPQQQGDSLRPQNPNRFKTLSGREPRYAAPPRPPAQFYSLPRRSNEHQKQPTTFCTKSAV